MNRILPALLFLFSSGFVQAESTCNDIPGTQSHAALKTNSGIVCFVKRHVASSLEEIGVYFISPGNEPVLAENGELPGDGVAAGKVGDAFLLDIDHDGKEEIIVIHSINTQYKERGPFREHFFIYVFNRTGKNLTLNERASDWFGSSQTDDSETYKFLYRNRQLIQQAPTSAYAALMVADVVISATVKEKSYLYEYPLGYRKSKKYLIAGDKVKVDKHQAEWCRINYSSGKAPLQMWMMCDALEPDTTK